MIDEIDGKKRGYGLGVKQQLMMDDHDNYEERQGNIGRGREKGSDSAVFIEDDDDIPVLLLEDDAYLSPHPHGSRSEHHSSSRIPFYSNPPLPDGDEYATMMNQNDERSNSLILGRIKSVFHAKSGSSSSLSNTKRNMTSVQTRSMEESNKNLNKHIDQVVRWLPFGIQKACAFLPEPNATWLLKEYRELKSSSSKFDDMCGNRDKKRNEWIEFVQRLPFGNLSVPPDKVLAMNSGEKAIYLENMKMEVNRVVHGMESAKNAALEITAKSLSAPNTPMRSLLLEGPPGCGKTTFSREGLCRVLQRPVRFINVGGLSDASNLIGHSYTYEGSKPGAIVRELINAGVGDPVFVFDEVDKISNTPKGEEIVSVLMSLVDPAQNAQYSDLYLGNIPFDVSRALFVFTCNDSSLVHPVLLDRVRKIQIPPMNRKDIKIATLQHLLPRIYREYNWGRSRSCETSNHSDSHNHHEHLQKLVDKLVETSSKSQDSDKMQGMRGIEKLLERVAMIANIRNIRMGIPQCEAGLVLEDIDETSKVIDAERKDIVSGDTLSHAHIYL
jgi:hypothetical protein